jgi:hypothetical protein
MRSSLENVTSSNSSHPLDCVVPSLVEHELVVSRMLADRGTEFRGKPEQREYELYLAIENIDPTRTKAGMPQDQRHLRTLPQYILFDAFYRVAFRKTQASPKPLNFSFRLRPHLHRDNYSLHP